jgi:hypothetical protein
MSAVGPTRFIRRVGPVSLALTAWDIWRRLPPRQRRQIIDIARKHGPKVATLFLQAGARAQAARRR